MLAVVACGNGTTSSEQSPPKSGATPTPGTPAVDPPKTDQAPGVRPDGEIVSAVDWFDGTLEQALERAKAEDKLLFVDVGAYWCPPCHALDEKVFVDPAVGEFLGKGYVSVHIDAEKGEGPELVERYHVQAFPTMLVLEATGIEKGRIVDFLPADDLMTALGRIATGDNVLAKLADAVEVDPDDLAKRYALGHAYLLAANREQAKVHMDTVVLGDPSNEMGLASRAMYDHALFVTYKLDRDPQGAIVEFRALQAKFPDSKDAVRAFRHIGRLYCKMGKESEAVASLDAMMATDPTSPDLASAYGWFSFRQRCGLEPALAVVRKGIVAAPDMADLRYVEAELLARKGNESEALAAIRKASELEPKSAFYRRMVRRIEGLAG